MTAMRTSKTGGGGAPRIHPGHDEEEWSEGERGVITTSMTTKIHCWGSSTRASVEMSSSAYMVRSPPPGILLQ